MGGWEGVVVLRAKVVALEAENARLREAGDKLLAYAEWLDAYMGTATDTSAEKIELNEGMREFRAALAGAEGVSA